MVTTHRTILLGNFEGVGEWGCKIDHMMEGGVKKIQCRQLQIGRFGFLFQKYNTDNLDLLKSLQK